MNSAEWMPALKKHLVQHTYTTAYKSILNVSLKHTMRMVNGKIFTHFTSHCQFYVCGSNQSNNHSEQNTE